MELQIKDEKQLAAIEALIEQGSTNVDLAIAIGCPNDPRKTIKLLKKEVKTMDEYEALCIQDSELSLVKAMDFDGQLKYTG